MSNKIKHYDITQTRYWKKFRQGVRHRGSKGNYSRAKRNNDIRWGARNNYRSRMTDDLSRSCNRKFQRRAKGLIRFHREGLERFEAQQAQLRKDVGM